MVGNAYITPVVWILRVVHLPGNELPLFFRRGPAGTVVGNSIVLSLLTVAGSCVFFIDLAYDLTKVALILRDVITRPDTKWAKFKSKEKIGRGEECIMDILLTAMTVWEVSPALCCALHFEQSCESTRCLYSHA